jgi:hypothetical protein
MDNSPCGWRPRQSTYVLLVDWRGRQPQGEYPLFHRVMAL